MRSPRIGVFRGRVRTLFLSKKASLIKAFCSLASLVSRGPKSAAFQEHKAPLHLEGLHGVFIRDTELVLDDHVSSNSVEA